MSRAFLAFVFQVIIVLTPARGDNPYAVPLNTVPPPGVDTATAEPRTVTKAAVKYYCSETPRNEADLSQCLWAWADDAEQELNDTYHQAMARLSAPRKSALREQERRWLHWREAECARQAKEAEECTGDGGCGEPGTMHIVCMTDAARRRTKLLITKWRN